MMLLVSPLCLPLVLVPSSPRLAFPTFPVTNHSSSTPSRLESIITSSLGFVDEHPGGAKILKRVGGKDATKQFWKYHNEGVLKKYSERLKIGTVKETPKL